MRSRKIIHIAGPLIGEVQKCTRCHARIDINRTWLPITGGKPSGWSEGVQVFTSRSGASIDPKTRSEYRPCGRSK